MSIAIVQLYSNAIKEYATMSFKNVRDYANLYDYLHYVRHISDAYEPTTHWAKVLELDGLLDAIDLSETKWLWIVDADVLIHDMTFSLEELINNQPKETKFIISENGLNGGDLCNSGSFLIHIDWIDYFLASAESYIKADKSGGKDAFFDQPFINKFVEENATECSVLPMNMLNSWWIVDEEHKSKFIHHFMGRTTEDKVAAMRKYLVEHL
jgi:hypothetical protein